MALAARRDPELRRAVLLGAALTLAITLPSVWLIRAFGPVDDSPLWVVQVAGLLIGPVAGGSVAARIYASRPALVGALAGALAFAVSVTFNIGRRITTGEGAGLAYVITSFVYLQITVSLATVAALITARRRARRDTERP